MHCPKCQSVIHEMRIEGVDIDFCSTCKGVWFDRDELAFMVELPGDKLELDAAARNPRRTEWPCPRCGAALEEVTFVKTSDLHVDRCAQCRGVWLDKGELPKVEAVAATIGDPRSKVMFAGRWFKENGYQVLGQA